MYDIIVMIVNDDIQHEESDMDYNQEEVAALMMLLPPPPPPAYIKLLNRRCLDCVISYLDAESRESMAHSCRFLSDACASADFMPAVGMQDDLSDISSSNLSSFDALVEASNNASQDLVHENSGVQAFVSDNPAPSFDEIDEIKSAAMPSRLSSDDGAQAFISYNPAPSYDEIDEIKSPVSPPRDRLSLDDGAQALISDDPDPSFDETDNTNPISLNSRQRSDPNSVSTPISVNDILRAANCAKMAESEGAEKLPEYIPSSAGYTIKPLCMKSLKSIHTPERRAKTPDRAFTPSPQSSSDSDDSESDNHGVEHILDSGTDQSSMQGTKEAGGVTFRSFLSDLIGDIFGSGSGSGSAEEVADLLTLDNNVRRNNIDDGPIKIGEKLYSHNEALKMWRNAKRNLEAKYAEVDASGNDKFDTTTFFEKSSMYKENETRVKDKRRSRYDRSSKKLGGSQNEAQERSLRKLMTKISLRVEDESVIGSVAQKSTQSTVVSQVVDSDNSNMGSVTQKTQATVVNKEVDSDNSNHSSSSCSGSFYSSEYSGTSSAGTSESNPSQLTWLQHLPQVSSKAEVDSVIGSNYGVEVSYKDATTPVRTTNTPERVVSTRKPRNKSHGLSISSKRLKNKSVKEDKKKSSRSLKLKLIKKVIK